MLRPVAPHGAKSFPNELRTSDEYHTRGDVEADRLSNRKQSLTSKVAFLVPLVLLIVAVPGLLMLASHTHGENPRAAKVLVSYGMTGIGLFAYLLAALAGRCAIECLLGLTIVLVLTLIIRMDLDIILPYLAGFLDCIRRGV